MNIVDELYSKLSKEQFITFFDRMSDYEKLKLCVSLDDIKLFKQVLENCYCDIFDLIETNVLYYIYKYNI
jgi:hypothetical protein